MSDASWYHHREAQNHSPKHSRSPFLAGGINFPPPSRMPPVLNTLKCTNSPIFSSSYALSPNIQVHFNKQKTIIDTLHKECKPQTFIAKEAGCSQSAVSKQVNRKLSGRKKCERKRCTTNQENRSLMRIIKQNRFKNLVELHKEWNEAGVKTSKATTHRRVKEFS